MLLDVSIMRIFNKKRVNDNIVLDVFIICQKLRHVQVFEKILYSYTLIDFQNNPLKHLQFAANDVEGIE